MLIKANDIDPSDFHSWIFCPAMLFNSPDKWWADHGRRDYPHEGIDFCLYRDRSGRMLRIHENTRIPVIHDGVVRARFADYLGEAVIIEHQNAQRGNETYLSVYAHTTPQDGIQAGTMVKKGDIIVTIAGTSRSKSKILPHLHFTLARPSPDLVYDSFVWNKMRDPDLVALQNPISIIDWPHHVLDPDDHYCLDL